MSHDDFSTEELTLAFSYQLVQRIIAADGEVVEAERRLMDRLFPADKLRELGFLRADGGFTQRWQDALGEALVELPVALSVDARLDLVETLWNAALADDEIHADEQAAVKHAARLLGLHKDQVVDRLNTSRDG